MGVTNSLRTLYKTSALFYVRGSVHRDSRLKISNKMQLYADIYLLLNYSTCFGRPSRPSSGFHRTVVAASGTDHTTWGVSSPDSVVCRKGCNIIPAYLILIIIIIIIIMDISCHRHFFPVLLLNQQ